ncbi:MAG: hypothetical protein GY822_27815 [Deltaproteobacteria bacterium]|nr:hypothetical protein [Deltaproteobacteria bacterium]
MLSPSFFFRSFRLCSTFGFCALVGLGIACDDTPLTNDGDDDAGMATTDPEPGGLDDAGEAVDVDGGAAQNTDGGAVQNTDAGTPSPDAGIVATPDAGESPITPDAGTPAAPDAGTPATPDAGTEPGLAPLRFIAMGDQGTGNTSQYAVSDVMESVCASQGCDFVLLLGDNIYDVGVDDVTDPQWEEKFELPYANIDDSLQFYPVLGNHDGGANGSGASISTGDIEVDYTAHSAKWNMPARYYRHSKDNVDVYALDTSSIFFVVDVYALDTSSIFFVGWFLDDYGDLRDNQADWLTAEFAARPANNWQIATGHHPYLSNGKHITPVPMRDITSMGLPKLGMGQRLRSSWKTAYAARSTSTYADTTTTANGTRLAAKTRC